MDESAADKSPAGPRPYWFPPEVPLESLPQAVQDAYRGLVEPAYRERVLAAATELERSAGSSLVFLNWLETISQIELTASVAKALARGARTEDLEVDIARHLRLVGRKEQLVKLSLALQRYDDQLDPISRVARETRSAEHGNPPEC
jgi:hypothetical protein